jgi:hypothetical protein
MENHGATENDTAQLTSGNGRGMLCWLLAVRPRARRRWHIHVFVLMPRMSMHLRRTELMPRGRIISGSVTAYVITCWGFVCTTPVFCV